MSLSHTAISIDATREASLYFDHVVPLLKVEEYLLHPDHMESLVGLDKHLAAQREWAAELSWPEEELPRFNEFMRSLLPHELVRMPGFFDALWRANFASALLETVGFTESLGVKPNQRTVSATVDDILDFFGRFRLAHLPVVTRAGAFRLVSAGDAGDDIAVTLATLDLIDASRASWQQLAELRCDVAARAKLRRLRVFAAGNYAGKGRSYVEDDLLARLNDYDETARRWGFETRQAVLTMLLNSKALAAAGTSLLSALFGVPPTVAGIGALAGAAVEVGRVSVEVSRRKFALSNMLRDNPVSYIADAKERLGPNA